MSQLRFSEEPNWKSEAPVANATLPEQAWKGLITREEPAIRTCIETRRKDVGQQSYASGTYQPPYIDIPDFGTLPTADAIFFLRNEYGDSSQPIPPTRFFK